MGVVARAARDEAPGIGISEAEDGILWLGIQYYPPAFDKILPPQPGRARILTPPRSRIC